MLNFILVNRLLQRYYKHAWWIYTCICSTIIRNITNLFLTSYGGPDTQKVTYKFQLGWEEFLVSSMNYIVAYADGRGGTGRGQKWLHANYKNLGTHEVEDAITAGRLIFWNPIILLEGYFRNMQCFSFDTTVRLTFWEIL